MLKLTILLGLALSGICYKSAQVETGSDNTIHWEPSPIHVLHSGNQIPRSVDVVVKFRNKFPNPPQVATAVTLLDWQSGSPQGFIVSVRAITTEQFVLRYTAPTPLQVYSIFVNWFAVYDPRIVVGYFETTSLGALNNGEGDRTATVEVPLSGAFERPPTAIAFLNGVKVQQKNWVVFVGVGSTTTTSLELVVRSWATTKIAMVRVCLIVGDSSLFWVSPDQGFRVPDNSHGWIKRNPSESMVPHQVNIPIQWQVEDRTFLVGFTGFDSDDSRNFRAVLRNFQLGTSTSTVELGTWADTQLYQLNYKFFVYRVDPKFRIFDPNCAELFTECTFEGDSITLCDQIISLPEQGWSKPIRSFTIPAGKSIKLYQQEGLRGAVVTFTKSSECQEDLDFSLIQLND